MMKAIIVQEFGGPEQLAVSEVSTPNTSIVVDAAWAGVNFIDIYQREGRYPGVQQPLALGIEGSGIISRVDEAATTNGWRIGDRVAYTTGVQGSYAEQVAVPAAHLVRVPQAVSLHDACAALEQGLTAIVLTEDVARLNAGSTVLVHAAAGGVGGWLVQLLVAHGHTVIGTASSDSKAAWLQSIGAQAVRYDGDADWVADVLRLTQDRGVDVVFDSVGKATFANSLKAAAIKGHVVLFGAASGQPDPVDVLQLMRKSITLTRPILPHYLDTPAALQSRAEKVFHYLQSGKVQLRVHQQYPLSDAGLAHRALAERGTQGKLLLAINTSLV